MATHYETLSVSPTAEPLVIEAAYKALIKAYHPDRQAGGADDARAKAINEAYRVLKDPELRAEYDFSLHMSASKPPPHRPPPPPAAPTGVSAPGSNGWATSGSFIGLAALLLICAAGSLVHGASKQPAPTESTDAPASAANSPPSPTALPDAPVQVPAPAPLEPDAQNTNVAPAIADNAAQGATANTPSASPAHRPSFDCAVAGTPSLRLICSNDALAIADSALARTFQQASRVAADTRALDIAQRAWMHRRDIAPADVGVLTDLYESRQSELDAAIRSAIPEERPTEHASAKSPTWTAFPSAEELSQYYPTEALRAGLEGAATIDCFADATGSLSDCTVITENPRGWRFGSAVVRASGLFRVQTQTQNGAPYSAGRVRFSVHFTLPGREAQAH